VITPVDDPAVATEVAELDHVPPVVVLVHVWEEPLQIGVVPDMVWLTGADMVAVFVPVLVQPPVVTVYEINAVPALIPVTNPVDPTVATPVAELLQVPPLVVVVQIAEVPAHMGVVPVIVCGEGTVIDMDLVAVLTHPPVVTL